MTRWIWIAALLGAAGCGDNNAQPDSAVDVCPSTCNPIAQTGCDAAERCTYVHDGAGGFVDEGSCGDPAPPPSCWPDGTEIPVGAACVATAGQVDDCEPTSVCIEGICRALCGTPTPTCAGTCAPVGGLDVCTPTAR